MWHALLPVGAVVLAVAIFVGVRRKRETHCVTEYFFFIRFPLLLGAAAFILPIVGYRLAPNMFGGLFVLQPLGIGFVVFAACCCAWAIVYAAMVLVYAAPFRTRLNYSLEVTGNDIDPVVPVDSGRILHGWRGYAGLLLIAPLLGLLIYRADGSRISAALAVAAGIAVAAALRTAVSWRLSGSRANKTSETAPKVRYEKMLRRARGFAIASGLIYVGIGSLGLFLPQEARAAVPALLYILALTLLGTVLVTWLSLAFDKYRIPIVSLLVVAIVGWKVVWPADHTYHVSSWKGQQPRDVREVLNEFSASRNGDLVLVAASGGGITASLWTTTVLRALDRLGAAKPDSIFDFPRHVALISSVSGGSVGAMYYVNAFGHSGRPEKDLDSIVDASSRSSLSAVAWGMMYPDFWRLVGGRVFSNVDRAWAQERRWRTLFGDSAPSLASWTLGVNQGWRPIQVFNATLEETGERLLLAPVALTPSDTSPKSPALWREFRQLYGGQDIDVATAARLSATFPFVTPHARPDVGDSLLNVAFHVADGGYYDNSGIVTALETISTWLNWSGYNRSARRIALVEIRAGGPIGESADKKATTKSIHSIVGPLNTLFNVRTTSQVARNLEEINLVRRFWACHPERPAFRHFVFRLSGESPLSWHLTRQEREMIHAHMETDTAQSTDPKMLEAMKQNAVEANSLSRFFVDPTTRKDTACTQP